MLKLYAATCLAAVITHAATELKVDVYEGPTECDAASRIEKGNYLAMHYTGKIDESSETGTKGKVFDSSRNRGQTFDFQIGQGRVIRGWDKGLIGLCVGAKATLVIPPEMGYGARGAGGDIPGGATLNFDVEVVSVSDTAPNGSGGPGGGETNLFEYLDADKDAKLTREEVARFFKENQQMDDVPDEVWDAEDANKDGFISWDEFSGPKGDAPPASSNDEAEREEL